MDATAASACIVSVYEGPDICLVYYLLTPDIVWYVPKGEETLYFNKIIREASISIFEKIYIRPTLIYINLSETGR